MAMRGPSSSSTVLRAAVVTRQRKPPAGPSSTRSSSSGAADKCDVFYASLADKLGALEQAVQPKWLTLEWVSLAVDFMRSTFSDMMILFEDHVRAQRLGPDHHHVLGASDEFWVEEYMLESMKLLDVCNVLKPAVSRFEHFVMCVQLVGQAIHRCCGGGEEFAGDETLMAALESCDAELDQLAHLPRAVEQSVISGEETAETELRDGLMRQSASIALGDQKFSVEESSVATAAQASWGGRNGSSSARSSGSGRGAAAALTLVMCATRETTDFVASVLIWALKRDPASHPGSAAWQRNLEVFRGDEALWSPSFRRLQERLRKELYEILRAERSASRRELRHFTFEELKLLQDCTADLHREVQDLANPQRQASNPQPSLHFLNNLTRDLLNLLDIIQVRLEKVSSQVSQLFDELVQARKKLLDAAQRPGTIHRSHTL